MRTLRMLYLALVYIFAVPVGLLFIASLFMYLFIKNAKEVLKVYVESLKECNKANMEWVETGKRKFG